MKLPQSASVEVIQRTVESIDWPSRNPAAHQAKRVEVDPGLLRANLNTIQVGDTLSFELFDGERVSAEVTKTQMWGRDAATLGVTASIDGQSHGFVTLSRWVVY